MCTFFILLFQYGKIRNFHRKNLTKHLFYILQVWFQNRRAKFRKRDNTKKGPGRPAHNAHPQTCSGEPMDPEEIRRREQDRLEKKRRKQEERLKKMEEKRKLLDENDIEGHKKLQKEFQKETELLNREDSDKSFDDSSEAEVVEEGKRVCAFSIDSLLEEPKVPRGRRPNSKYPRVQASKSYPSMGLGMMMPLYPITQPIGFVVEQRQDEIKSDSDNLDNSTSSDEGSDHVNPELTVQSNTETINHYDSESEDIDITDEEGQ